MAFLRGGRCAGAHPRAANVISSVAHSRAVKPVMVSRDPDAPPLGLLETGPVQSDSANNRATKVSTTRRYEDRVHTLFCCCCCGCCCCGSLPGPTDNVFTLFRLLITSVLRLIGLGRPWSLRNRPHALHSTEPDSSRRQSGVVLVSQFWQMG